jgi:anti-sigma B factor antagonist
VDNLRLTTRTRERDGLPILEVKGEIDVFTAPLFKQAVVNLVSDGHHHLFIDMSGVEFMDSSGFGTLLGATKRLRPEGGSVHLFACSPTIERMLHLIRLDMIVGVHASEHEAIASVSEASSQLESPTRH